MTAGYGGSFVKTLPEDLQSECPICLQILREPFVVSCCGYRFCRGCITKIRNSRCPLCSENFSSLPDKHLERTLNDKEVRCADDCGWIGKLANMDEHLVECLSQRAQLLSVKKSSPWQQHHGHVPAHQRAQLTGGQRGSSTSAGAKFSAAGAKFSAAGGSSKPKNQQLLDATKGNSPSTILLPKNYHQQQGSGSNPNRQQHGLTISHPGSDVFSKPKHEQHHSGKAKQKQTSKPQQCGSSSSDFTFVFVDKTKGIELKLAATEVHSPTQQSKGHHHPAVCDGHGGRKHHTGGGLQHHDGGGPKYHPSSSQHHSGSGPKHAAGGGGPSKPQHHGGSGPKHAAGGGSPSMPQHHGGGGGPKHHAGSGGPKHHAGSGGPSKPQHHGGGGHTIGGGPSKPQHHGGGGHASGGGPSKPQHHGGGGPKHGNGPKHHAGSGPTINIVIQTIN